MFWTFAGGTVSFVFRSDGVGAGAVNKSPTVYLSQPALTWRLGRMITIPTRICSQQGLWIIIVTRPWLLESDIAVKLS